jgi:LAO/AO transport system kinase
MDDIVPGAEDDVLGVVRKWTDEGRDVALATVVTTWGSSPRPVGSQLAVDGSGHFVGSVSAGCVESAVVDAAAGVIKEGKPRLLDFGVADDKAWEVGLSCGGRIEIFVEKVSGGK